MKIFCSPFNIIYVMGNGDTVMYRYLLVHLTAGASTQKILEMFAVAGPSKKFRKMPL
jgi:hypothetical protein